MIESNKNAENLRDKFKDDCKKCFDIAEEEIHKLFDDIGYENRCDQGYLYERLRSTPNKVKFMNDYFNSGPSELVTLEGFGSTWFYECVQYSHELGIKLLTLSDKLQSTISCKDL